jgi:hypothetical protein
MPLQTHRNNINQELYSRQIAGNIHTATYFLRIPEQDLVNARCYRNTEHNKTRTRRTETSREEVLQGELYSTLYGDINTSTITHGVTNITPLNVNFDILISSSSLIIII